MGKEECGSCKARSHRLGTPWCSARRTYEGGVKPFGSTVKKEVRSVVESREQIWGYVGGVWEFENEGQKPLGPRERAQRILENGIFGKKYRKCWCRRIEWYIALRNVGRTEQR